MSGIRVQHVGNEGHDGSTGTIGGQSHTCSESIGRVRRPAVERGPDPSQIHPVSARQEEETLAGIAIRHYKTCQLIV